MTAVGQNSSLGGVSYVARRKGDRAMWHFLGRIPQVGEGLERETGLVVWLNGYGGLGEWF